ncbi:MAG: HesA/MoeB/ThiF family protein [Bacteroidales bacterium]|jgi:adenylyltransferase/sulfurtransferase|nr:HesA/MoeB/ThiF family protein [Bacteroidales bacterium]
MERYSRQIMLSEIGEKGQRKIRETSVLVIGAGGLGSAVCPYLVAAGIGKLTVIDADTVSVHNLQRQILYRETQTGKSKALEAQKSLQSLNSEVEINALCESFSIENAVHLVKDADIVVDATDNFKTRYLINDVCVGLNKPFIYGAICEFSGQLAVFNYKQKSTYRCLFPDEKEMIASQKHVVGVFGILPGIIGCLQVNEVIKLITQCGDLLNDRLFCLNLQNNQTFIVDIPPSEDSRNSALENFHKNIAPNYS